MYLAIFILPVIIIFLLFFFHFKKKKIIGRLRHMCPPEKHRMLDELAAPLGYRYIPEQEILCSRTDAWQKHFGYRHFFDRVAPFFHMIFDCQPIYFDYEGRTWLIEFWKGQYGINAGCEIGIYRADSIVPPKQRKKTLFHVVSREDYLDFSTRLYDRGHEISHLSDRHWWLAGFLMGYFVRPKDLTMKITIHFAHCSMRAAFMEALENAGYPVDTTGILNHPLDCTFTFAAGKQRPCLFMRIYRGLVQCMNRLYCKLYRFITRPFTDTCDRLLYLYYYFPFVFRRILRNRHRKKRHCRPRCK